jgi:metallo-beta-lactamase class B
LLAICIVIALIWTTGIAQAQTAGKAAAQARIDKAKVLAYEPGQDLADVFDTLCGPAMSDRGPQIPGLQVAPALKDRKVPERDFWYSDPAKVFDNLYWIGSLDDSTWAVMTTQGIILVDSGYDYSIKERVEGLKKLGADPAQIKYVVLSHAHGDRYFGAKYLQDTYKARVVMSEADWGVLVKSNEPNEIKPKKDMIATDGMKLTLGDTTITLHLTPGHTPGTISTIIPLRDGNQKHVGVIWGGMAPSYERYGVRYYSSLQETFKTWSDSIKRFTAIEEKAGGDVYLAIHPHYDRTIEKLRALRFRKPGAPHPFVNANTVKRFMTIMGECTDAQLARVTS